MFISIKKFFKYTSVILSSVTILFLILTNSSKAVEYNKLNIAKVKVLNKITGKASTFDVAVNNIFHFDNHLSFVIRACYRSTQKYTPESVMFIQVAESFLDDDKESLNNNSAILNNANKYLEDKLNFRGKEYKPKDGYPVKGDGEASKNNDESSSTDEPESGLVFSGWMFSNRPTLSELSDPTYDITLVRCFDK